MRSFLNKTIFLFLFFPVSNIQGNNILFEELSIQFNNLKVDSALSLIENEIDHYFIYNADLVSERPLISSDFTNYPLSVILDSLFNNPILNYKILDNQIVVFKDRDKIKKQQIAKTQEQKFKQIRGYVIDKADRMPLPYSNISIYNRSSGTISNFDGEFSFKIKEEYHKDSIVISHVGYKPLFIKPEDIGKTEIFQLETKPIPLQEILIRWQDPREILKNALRATKDNYPDNPTQLRAFYRESLQRNNKYMLYIEGLLDVYKSAYRPTLFRDQAKLLQLRKFTNVHSTDTILFKLQGGIDASVTLDLMREPLDFIKPGELYTYNYYYDGIESFNDSNVHKISFLPNTNNENNDYEGEIFIDTESLAIVKINFNLIKQSAKRAAYNYVLRSKPSIKVIPRSISYSINYKKIDDRHYVNHIICDMSLKVKRKRKLLASNYKIHFEMITTDVTTTDVQKFDRKERLKPRMILTDHHKSYIKNLDNYWGTDNFIVPENDLLKALKKFKVEELTYESKEIEK